MHEHSNDGPLAADGAPPRLAAWQSSLQPANSNHAVAPSRPQHGPRLAAPTGHPAARRGASLGGAADMGCLRASGHGHRCPESAAHADERLARMGEPAGDADTPVCTQEQMPAAGGAVTTSSVFAMIERQRFRCAMTGRQLTPQTAALDHIVPIRCGGRHVIENTQVLHKDVNRAKGSLTNEEFITLCREVVTWTDGRFGHG
jgi:hypothetical protein